VTAVGVARRVGVVLEQVDVAADAFVGKPLLGVNQEVSSTHSPARSWVTSCTRLSHSAVAYSGWLPTSRYRRAPLREKHWSCDPMTPPAEKVAGYLVRAQPPMAVECAGDTELVSMPIIRRCTRSGYWLSNHDGEEARPRV